MGLFDFFKSGSRNQDGFDPLRDLELSRLKVGFFVDYDLKTWEVTAYNRYDYGEGLFADEWELSAADEKYYLERYEDDEVEWSLCKKIPLALFDEDVIRQIIDRDDPPRQITVEGKAYHLDESGSAYFYKDGLPPKIGFIAWDFIDESDEHFITIEQWGEESFEAVRGFYVEEYQFTNILPHET